MKHLIIILALVCGVFGAWKSGLRVRFSVGLRPGTDFFIAIPRTVEQATSEGLTVTERPPGPMPSLVMYCYGDRIVCPLFDSTNKVAGLQIAVPQEDITENTKDFRVQGFVEWTTTTGDGETKKFWAIQQYFVSEETLNMDSAATSRSADVLRNSALWVTGFNGELIKISNSTADIEKSEFTRQACIPWMGRHYYYKMTKEASCDADKLLAWFPIGHSGQLISSGLILHGKLHIKAGHRNWFEKPGRLAVQAIVPEGPECLYKLADEPGIVTIHIYYVETPWSIGCLEN